MVKSIRNEFYKICKSNKFLIFSLIVIGISLAMGGLIRMIEIKGLIPQDQMNLLTGGAFSEQVLSTIADILLPILATLLVCFLVIDETNAGTLKLPFLCGYSRSTVLIAKMVAVLITMLAIMFMSWISASITAMALWGINTVIQTLLSSLLLYMETYLAIAGWTIIIFFVAFFMQNGGTMIGVIAVFLLICSLFMGFFPEFSKLFVPYYFKGFMMTKSSHDILLGIGVCVATSVIFGLLAFGKFKRTEINK